MRNLGLLSLLLIAMACTNPSRKFNIASGEIWNTRYRVVYQSDRNLEDSINEVFSRIDRSVSVFNDSSIVSRINRNETAEVDSVFQRVFEVAKSVNYLTRGAFDPTIGPLIETYGFGRNHCLHEPSANEIDSMMQFVGIAECGLIDGKIYKKSPQTTFNFSGIAKGYAVDLIAEMLRRNGVGDYLVEVGGDIAVSGKNEVGKPWAILLEPTKRIIQMTEGAVATSGNYRKNHSGFGHIIDPRSGYPTEVSAPAVSVIAPTCIMADAIATACMVTEIDTLNKIEIIREQK